MYIPGTILLWLAFLLGAASTVAYALVIRGREHWRLQARQTYALMTAAVVVASVLLMYLLVTHDYRLAYVWSYSDNLLPLNYLISSFWGGQEGSFLLWVFWGVLLGLPLMRFARGYESRVMPIYNLTLLSLILLLLRQDPFRFHEGLTTAARIPIDGQGLNPLLQNPWMVIHPPVMFIGYASLAIPFSFALAALWMKRYDEWTKVSLPWVLLSLATLGLAIMLGGYWAYETLGWGGYWGWDPVENASLVPWLMTAALTHGMLLQRGRNRFRRLNVVLAIAAYLLVVYATFLTRSGVLGDFSVHSFVDLGITGWLVFNMAFFLVFSVGMLAWRWREIPTEVGDEPFLSRTIFFVVGILLLILIAVIVGPGTSAPLISRLWGEPAQVGPDFYKRMGIWLAVAFSAFLGATPFLGWAKARENAGTRLAVVLTATAALVGLGFVLGVRGWMALVYVSAALFNVVANGWATVDKGLRGQWRAAGGVLSHVGIGLMMLAFLTTGWLGHEQKVKLQQDEPKDVLGYTLTFRGIEKPTPTARDAMVVEVTDSRGRNFVLKPRMWVNQKSNQLVANPDIRSFLTKDLYLAPVEFEPGEEPAASGRLVLTKGQPQQFKDWTLTFMGFDLSRQNAVPGALTVGMLIELERPGEETVALEPSVISMNDGTVQAVAVDIPGVPGGRLRTAGMNVDEGAIRVELLGLGGGIGRTAVLHKGETLAYEDLRITFSDFDLSEFDPEGGKINFGVVFLVEHGGQTLEVVPTFRGGMGGQTTTTPAVVPGTDGVTLSIGRVDAEGGAVQLQVIDPSLPAEAPATASLVLDVSTKPLIGLVWLGTILVVVGVVMAIVLRRIDVASIPVSESQ
jgi:cytochrome c-type biogenesis protein CcmF